MSGTTCPAKVEGCRIQFGNVDCPELLSPRGGVKLLLGESLYHFSGLSPQQGLKVVSQVLDFSGEKNHLYARRGGARL